MLGYLPARAHGLLCQDERGRQDPRHRTLDLRWQATTATRTARSVHSHGGAAALRTSTGDGRLSESRTAAVWKSQPMVVSTSRPCGRL
eukprot:8995559-Alexandrium_andersonii.AAC.1